MRLHPLWMAPVALALLALAWQAGGYKGLLLLFSGLVMWALLHINRMMTVMRRANESPVGYVDSAVMLNARLRAGQSLLHVMALTRAMGERLSPLDEQDTETFRWQDPGHSSVTARFRHGRLVQWQLHRPAPAEADASHADAAPRADAAHDTPASP